MPRRYSAPRALLTLALLLALLPAALRPAPALAATCEVTNGNNDGAGSLRAAIGQTDGYADCATITFKEGLAQIVTTSYLIISRDVTIRGPGAGALTVRHGGDFSSVGGVFYITGGR